MDGAPVHVMLLQHLLHLVIFSYVAKPAVQLGEHNQIDLPRPYILQQPLQLQAFRCRLAGRYAGVHIMPSHLDPVFLRPGVQGLPLRIDGQAVDRLLFGADAAVQRRPDGWQGLVFNFHVDFPLFV